MTEEPAKPRWITAAEVENRFDTTILVSTYTLNDSQIKNLPASPVSLIPSPGTGKWISIIQMILTSHFEGGAYAGFQDHQGFSTQASTFIRDDAANSATLLTDFFGNSFGAVNLLILRPFLYGSYTVAQGLGVLEQSGAANFYDNQPLNLIIVNGNTPWTGGHPNNTLKVKTIYTIEDI